jgi:hypothetical protein
MHPGIMKWGFIPAWLLVLLWPWPSGSNLLLAFAVCSGAMLGFQAGRAGNHFWKTGHATVPCKVKYEN